MRWVGSEISVEVVIERRERPDAARHHRHRVGVAPEALIEPAHLLVHHGVAGDTVVEVGLLRSSGKLAVEQEVAGLEEVAVLRQLFDGIAAIEQNALIAVDVGDLGLAASGRCVSGIVREHPGLGVELADVDDRRADRSLVDRKRALPVADDELAGFDVGAGLRIHDRALGCVARWTARRAGVGLVQLLRTPGTPAGEAALCVAHPSVRCKMARISEVVCPGLPARACELRVRGTRGWRRPARPDRAAGRGFPAFPAPPARRKSGARWCAR